MAFVDLDALKDDLGIAGSTHDTWLQRRINGALALMSDYTHRYIGPLATFTDTWRPENYEVNNRPYWPMRDDAVFTLRNFPVSSITSAQDDGIAQVAGDVIFDKKTGQLIGYGNVASPNRFNMPTIEYVAGWATLPANLYEALVGIIAPQWEKRANASAGLSGVGSVSIQDVGDIDFSDSVSGTSFERASMSGVVNPLLGPYVAVLDSYIDYRGSFNNVLFPRTSDPVVVEEP